MTMPPIKSAPENYFASPKLYEEAKARYDAGQRDNKETSLIECYEFVTNPPNVGERYGMYITKIDHRNVGTLTTWMGDVLGWFAYVGPVHYAGWSKRRIVTCECIDGNVYRGVWGQGDCAGDLVIMKRVK